MQLILLPVVWLVRIPPRRHVGTAPGPTPLREVAMPAGKPATRNELPKSKDELAVEKLMKQYVRYSITEHADRNSGAIQGELRH